MKKFLLFVLLSFPLWGGICLAQETGKFCTTKCDIYKERGADCLKNLNEAQTDFKAKADEINPQVDALNKEITERSKTYLECYSAKKPQTPAEQNQAEIDCKKKETYDDPVAKLRLEIVKIKKPLIPLEKSLQCAQHSYAQAQLLQLGENTSDFDLKNLQASDVSKEINLDIVDDVEGENNILNRVLKLMTQVIGTFAVLMLIVGGYFMITSQGDESQLQKGKNIFFYTIVGLLIAFMSFIAVQFVISLIFTSTG